MKTCIERFGNKLPGHFCELIKIWSMIPDLAGLSKNLLSCTESARFFDYYSEARIAKHLLSQGWNLLYEGGENNAKKADFKIVKENDIAFLHIKRLNVDMNFARELKLQSRLELLRRIDQPIICSLVFLRKGTDQEMQGLYSFMKRLLCQGTIGKGKYNPSDERHSLVEWETRSWKTDKVQLIVTGPAMALNDMSRFSGKLDETHKQFQDGGLNIILMTSEWPEDDIDDYVKALCGSTATVQPCRKYRTFSNVYGPFEQGCFWADMHNMDSNIAIWFKEYKGILDSTGWIRGDYYCPDSILHAFSPLQSSGY